MKAARRVSEKAGKWVVSWAAMTVELRVDDLVEQSVEKRVVLKAGHWGDVKAVQTAGRLVVDSAAWRAGSMVVQRATLKADLKGSL